MTAPNCARVTVEVFAWRTVVVFAATATRDVVVGIVIIVIILVRERVRRRPTGDSGTLWPDMWRGRRHDGS